MIKEILQLVSAFGAWGVVAILVVILAVVMYKQYKKEKDKKQEAVEAKVKAEHKAEMDKMNNATQSIVGLLKKIVADNAECKKEVCQKLNKVEKAMEKVETEIDNIDKAILKESMSKEVINNNIRTITDKMVDIAIDLKGLALYVKKNGNGGK